MDVTWWMIGLGIVWGLFVLPILFMAVMAIPGNPGPNDPMLLLPPLLLFGAVVLGVACVCGILFGVGWLSPHGLWRGETVLLAPLAILLLIMLAFVRYGVALLCMIAVAALLIFLSQYSWLFLAPIGILAAIFVLRAAGILHRNSKTRP